MKCNLCGSGISAETETKRNENGNVHHYVYYSCSRSRDRYCKAESLREEEVIRQIAEIIDERDLDKVNLVHKIQNSKRARAVLALPIKGPRNERGAHEEEKGGGYEKLCQVPS